MTRILNPTLDLKMERIVPVSPEKIWAAWTQPEHLKQWFCPRPWMTTQAELDLKPGGIFRTVMEGPAGEKFNNTGCYLELVPNKLLTWTNALEPGFRPAKPDKSAPVHFFFTASIEIEPHPTGAKYTAYALHTEEAACQQHASMGFEQGWGAALDQLVELMR
jgi:uncharacterized protein YndB with AHSA1/START domain